MAINDTEGRPILRFGVLGLGQAAAQALPALAAHPNIRITAAADVRQDALDKFAQEYGGQTHRSVEELCASADVDVVHIATPTTCTSNTRSLPSRTASTSCSRSRWRCHSKTATA